MVIDHNYTDEIVCPYCGETFSNSHEYFGEYDNDVDDLHCDECEKDFSATRNISVSFTTFKSEKETTK